MAGSSVDGECASCTRATCIEAGGWIISWQRGCPICRARGSQTLIKEGRVRKGEATIGDPNFRVKPGESYAVTVPPPIAAEPQPQDIPLVILHEDDDIVVIDKQAGLVVHPAAGNLDGTLVNALLAHCGASLKGIGGVARPGIVHRLDKDTSGVTGRGQERARNEEPRQAIRRAQGGTRLSRARLGRAARAFRIDRRQSRAQPVRPQTHGRPARAGQARAHALCDARDVRDARQGVCVACGMPAGDRTHAPDPASTWPISAIR